MWKFLTLGLMVLGLFFHPTGAHAQTACSALNQTQLLNSFADTAPAGSITPRNVRDFVCSSTLTASSLISFGSSLYPTAVPSIQTTCSIQNTSANATCPAGLAINLGDTVFCSPTSDCPTDGGVFPTVVSYNPSTGATVFTTAATTTNPTEAVRFGSGQRFDINSSIMANSVFAEAGKFGDAAQGRTWWADNNIGYTSNLTNTGPALTVGSNGNIISLLVASHALGANSWHQIALDILVRADATALVSGNRNSIWGQYVQVDNVNSAASFSEGATVSERKLANRWGIVDID